MNESQAAEILRTLPARISDVIAPWAQTTPDQPALVEASGTWTYRELAAAIESGRSLLRQAGVRAGDRVLLVCENCRAYAAILLATASLDAWPVLVNARLSAQEIDQIREHCGARRVIYFVGVSAHAMKHAKRHNAAVEEFLDAGTIAIGELNESVSPEALEPDIAGNVGALIYTSGTTGLPKGVMLSHRGILFMASVSSKIRSIAPEDKLLGVLPMSHAVGLATVLLGTLTHGATLYLASRFDPVSVLNLLETAPLSIIFGAPAMFSLLADYCKMKGLAKLSFPALRVISSSGAPLQAPVKAEVERLFGMTLHNGYGVTETSPTISFTRLESPRSDLSVGRIFPGITIRLVDALGGAVAPGEVGELHVKGPTVMKGYYHAPEETAAAIDADGWFNTRDLARVEDQHLFIEGRTKELIVRFGFNVYPAEVESVLHSHPDVARAAVIGRPTTGDGGEEVIAFLLLKPGAQQTAEQLAEFAARNLAAYKRPSQILIVDSMPLTPTGKVMKDQLARQFETGIRKA